MGLKVDPSVTNKWRLLVEKLIEATQEGRIEWKESSLSNTYLTSLGNNNIKFGQASREDSTVYFFRIEDGFGSVIERFNDEDIDDLLGGKYFDMLQDFYSQVARKVAGADEVLDDLLSRLS